MKQVYIGVLTILMMSCSTQVHDNVQIQQAGIFSISQDDDNDRFNCGHCGQIQMNQMAAKEAAYYDSLLNVQYKIVMGNFGGAFKEQIRESQRTWLKMRDQNKEIKSKLYEGGSIAPFLYHKQVTEDTKNRIRFLEILTNP